MSAGVVLMLRRVDACRHRLSELSITRPSTDIGSLVSVLDSLTAMSLACLTAGHERRAARLALAALLMTKPLPGGRL